MSPHIPIKRRKGRTDDDVPSSAGEHALYRIYDEKNNPLVIDLDAIDECQRQREHRHFATPEQPSYRPDTVD